VVSRVLPEAAANEEITNYPSTRYLNAIKYLDEQEGLGIGFLNAITEKNLHTIKNTETDE
jgi:hypothetical protein